MRLCLSANNQIEVTMPRTLLHGDSLPSSLSSLVAQGVKPSWTLGGTLGEQIVSLGQFWGRNLEDSVPTVVSDSDLNHCVDCGAVIRRSRKICPSCES